MLSKLEFFPAYNKKTGIILILVIAAVLYNDVRVYIYLPYSKETSLLMCKENSL